MNLATEDYLLLVSKKNVVDVRLEKRIVDHTSGIVPGLGNIALDKVATKRNDI